jgi:hypothetical protein
MTVFLVFIGTAAGFYVSWCVWLSIVATNFGSLSPEARTDVSFFTRNRDDFEICLAILKDPALAWSFVRDVYDTGIWTLGKEGFTVKGPLLLIFWIFEFLFFEIVTLKDAWESASSPFYEMGNIWYKKHRFRKVFRFPESYDMMEITLKAIRNSDFGYFARAPFATEDDPGYIELEIYTAKGSFDAYGTVRVKTVNSKRQKETYLKHDFDVVKHARISSEVAGAILKRIEQEKLKVIEESKVK